MTFYGKCKLGHDINGTANEPFNVTCFHCVHLAMNSKDWLEENKQGFQEGWSRYFKTCEQIKQTCTDAQRELKQVREHMREDCEMQLEHMRAENQRQSAEHQLQIKTMQDQQQLEIAMKDNTIKMLQEKLADQTARCDAFSKKFNQMANIFKKTFWMQDIDTPQGVQEQHTPF